MAQQADVDNMDESPVEMTPDDFYNTPLQRHSISQARFYRVRSTKTLPTIDDLAMGIKILTDSI